MFLSAATRLIRSAVGREADHSWPRVWERKTKWGSEGCQYGAAVSTAVVVLRSRTGSQAMVR